MNLKNTTELYTLYKKLTSNISRLKDKDVKGDVMQTLIFKKAKVDTLSPDKLQSNKNY